MDLAQLNALVDDDNFEIISDGEFGTGPFRLNYCGKPPEMANAFDLVEKKWDILARVSEHEIVRDGSWTTCAFCRTYDSLCTDCPINEAGYHGCKFTPYQTYHYAVVRKDREGASDAAYAEIKFLRELRESMLEASVNE